jgi:hypothetical protein
MLRRVVGMGAVLAAAQPAATAGVDVEFVARMASSAADLTVHAASYPQIVALTRLLVSPFWRAAAYRIGPNLLSSLASCGAPSPPTTTGLSTAPAALTNPPVGLIIDERNENRPIGKAATRKYKRREFPLVRSSRIVVSGGTAPGAGAGADLVRCAGSVSGFGTW